MTYHERVTKTLKDYIAESVEELESGGSVYVRGGYYTYNDRDAILNAHYHQIVQKLSSLGYTYTTNHGHGCYDYTFTKKIEL